MSAGLAAATTKVETSKKAGELFNSLSKKGLDVEGIFSAVNSAVCDLLVLGVNETGEPIECLKGEMVRITLSIDDLIVLKQGGN